MIINYRGTSRPNNESVVTRRMEPTMDGLGNQTAQTWTWTVNGTIIGTGGSDAAIHTSVTTQRLAIETLFSQNGGNLILYDADGTTVIYSLLSSQCLNGPRVKSYMNPSGGPGDYVSSLPFTIEVEGIIPLVATASKSLLKFSEELSIKGNGGLEFVIRHPRNVKPIKQIISLYTEVTATQSGSASAASPWPSPPKPIWPEHLLNPEEEAKRSYSDGKYNISWSYRFAAIEALSGVPNLP